MYRMAVLTMVMAAVLCAGAGCDADFDGVADADDLCENTPLCATVDEKGCPSDDDGDGVANGCDECEDTPTGETVYANGCAVPTDGVPSRCQGPDPACMEIQYSLVSQTSDTAGTVLIKGVVQNIGTEDYLSDPNQQSVQLWADGVMVALTPFEDLVVDEQVTVEEERSWDTESEFPPVEHYQLIVTYDPDILLDENVNNNDCRFSNNSIIRSKAGIDALFD